MSGSVTTYTEEVAEAICARIAEGEPLRAICRSEGMPAWRTVYDWLAKNEQFKAAFELAREIGYDALAQQCLEISDDEQHDWVLTKKGVISNEVAVGRAKLQVWTRLQLLAKWAPKKYGDKLTTEHTGPNGGPIQIVASEHDENL